MSNRVSIKDLEAIVSRINRMTDSPMDSYTVQPDGKYKANIGNYHLSGAYGGWTLHRMCSDGGGVEDVLRCGYVSKRELQKLLFAFISGIEVDHE